MLSFENLTEIYSDDVLDLKNLQLVLKSSGSSSNKKFLRTEKWLKFGINVLTNVLNLTSIANELEKIKKFLYDILTEEINDTDFFSISLSSGNNYIYLKPAKKSINTFKYLDQIIQDSDCLSGDEIEIRIATTQNIYDCNLCSPTFRQV